MAKKIRCDECRKKIVVDEAFGGQMCRCPYCKALVQVPEWGEAAAGKRPETPTRRPETPMSPGAQPAVKAAVHAAADEFVPMARPVRFQGVVTLVLLAGLIGMAVGAMYMWKKLVNRPVPTPPAPIATASRPAAPRSAALPVPHTATRPAATLPARAPAATKPAVSAPQPEPEPVINGPEIAGLTMETPVVICVDGGEGMGDMFDYAKAFAYKGAESMGEKEKFNLVCTIGEGVNVMSDGFIPGGEKGREACVKFLGDVYAGGAADISAALQKALDLKPKSILLISRKNVDDAKAVAARAKAQGVRIFCASFSNIDDVNESMRNLAKSTGGRSRTFTQGQADGYLR